MISPIDYDSEQDTTKMLEDKILHVFQTYPIISPSMLQISLGSSLPTAIWKPVLESLLEQQKLYRSVKSVTAPNGRTQNAVVLSVEPQV